MSVETSIQSNKKRPEECSSGRFTDYIRLKLLNLDFQYGLFKFTTSDFCRLHERIYCFQRRFLHAKFLYGMCYGRILNLQV